jgi:hypothetical protein
MGAGSAPRSLEDPSGWRHGVRRLARALTALTVLGSLLAATAARSDSGPVNLRELPGSPALSKINMPSTVSLAGTPFFDAIVGAPPSGGGKVWQVDFSLDGKYGSFSTLAGVGDKLGAKVTAVFSVVGDGKVIQKSDPLHSGDEPYDFDALDVSGVKKLSLVVTSTGVFPPKVVWGDPKVTAGPAPAANPPAAADPGPDSPAPTPDTPAPAPPPVHTGPPTLIVVPFGAAEDDQQEVASSITSMVNQEIAADVKADVSAPLDVLPPSEVRQEVGDVTGYLSPDQIEKVVQDVGAKYFVTGSMTVVKVDNHNIFGVTKTTWTIDFDGKVQDATGKTITRATGHGKKDGTSVAIGGNTAGDGDDKILDKAEHQAVDDFCVKVRPLLKAAAEASPK